MNQVLLFGNLGADPEVKNTSVGPVCNLRLATNRSWIDKETNTEKKDTQWHRIAVFGARGEALGRMLKKGERIFVKGRLHTSSYEKDGVKKYSTEIIAEDVTLFGGNRPSEDASPPGFMSSTNGGYERRPRDTSESIPF